MKVFTNLVVTVATSLFSNKGFVGVGVVATTFDTPNDDYAQDLECNTVIGTVSVAEIQAVASTFVALTTTTTEVNITTAQQSEALDVYMGRAQYNVLVSRVCGSCADFTTEMAAATDDPTSYETYCGNSVYGYDAMYSALVMHPLNGSTTEPASGIRNVHFTFQSTRLGMRQEPSVHFPSNITERMALLATNAVEWLTTFIDSFTVLVAASSGVIAISPDPLGTGTSALTHDRSYLTAMPIQQAAVVSYYATATYTDTVTQGCTVVGSDVIALGYSSAGANVIWGALALQQQNLNVVRSFTQGAVYNNAIATQAALVPFLADLDTAELSTKFAGIIAFVMASYSNEMTFLSNTGTGQFFLSGEYGVNATSNATDVLSWIFDEKVNSATLGARFPQSGQDVLDAVNDDVVNAVRAAVSAGAFWCTPGTNFVQPAALCNALNANSPTAVVSTLTFPAEWCHSPDDDLVLFDFTSSVLSLFDPPTFVQYQPELPFMQPSGSHVNAHMECGAAVGTWLRTADGQDFLEPVPVTDNGTCGGTDGTGSATSTSSPTTTTTDSETSSPTTTTTSTPTMAPNEASGVSAVMTTTTTMTGLLPVVLVMGTVVMNAVLDLF